MSRKSSISPWNCLPIIESMVANPESSRHAFTLPESFPVEILTDDQLEAIQQWFDTWAGDLLHALRLALIGHRQSVSKHQGASPVDLKTLQLHAVVLAHLLRLHPAAEPSLPELAKSMGLPFRSLYYARDTILAYIKPVIAGTISRHSALAEFWQVFPSMPSLDTAAASMPDPSTILVPFKHTGPKYNTLKNLFATKQHLASSPAVAAVHDDLDADGRTIIKITLKN